MAGINGLKKGGNDETEIQDAVCLFAAGVYKVCYELIT